MVLWNKHLIAKDGYKPDYREIISKILLFRKQAIIFKWVFCCYFHPSSADGAEQWVFKRGETTFFLLSVQNCGTKWLELTFQRKNTKDH